MPTFESFENLKSNFIGTEGFALQSTQGYFFFTENHFSSSYPKFKPDISSVQGAKKSQVLKKRGNFDPSFS